jgi:hypothetical protein
MSSNSSSQWFLVDGPYVNNVRIPASDPDEAARIAAAVAEVDPSTLRVYVLRVAFTSSASECWHTAQLF